MSKICPINNSFALSQDCIECENKLCKKERHKIVIGIDQSYKNSGISICKDGQLTNIKSIHLETLKNNSEKRKYLANKLHHLFDKIQDRSNYELLEVCVIIEQIRMYSQGFVNIDYIKSIGALNAMIVDTASEYNFPVYSVDTRAWKAAIVGTSKPQKNPYGINPEKWPTIKYICSLGFEEEIKISVNSKRKKKGVIERNGERFIYNDDAADSACIALYGFINKSKQKLELEH